MENNHDTKHLFLLEIITRTDDKSMAYIDGKRRARQYKAYILI